MLPTSMTTTSFLLDGLLEPGNEAIWREFDQRYRPVVFGLAERLGLGPEDAADAAQDTLVQFLRDYQAGKYDRQRGRLRAWILGIARHRIADVRRRAATRREHRGESAFADLPEEERLSELWNEQCRQTIFARALEELEAGSRLSPKTLQAFKLLALQHRPAAEVAAELGMSLRSVYLAKHRCLGKLREIIAALEAVYES